MLMLFFEKISYIMIRVLKNDSGNLDVKFEIILR